MTAVRALEPFVERREPRGIAWVRPDLVDEPIASLWRDPAPLAGAKGRGGVGVLVVGGVECVVRPYRRGGALAALLRDRYGGPGRARAELAAILALRHEGVPVVVPVAAAARRSGAFWRLRLLTERLADALPLPDFLAAHAERRRDVATSVGVVLRLAFAAGLRHPDLHADNILCVARGDRMRVVLVDLDRAVVGGPVDERGRDAMLARLQRYWLKHRATLAARPSRAETMRALRQIAPDRAERQALWRRLARRLARAHGRQPLRRRES
jgi:3-deoxy-D-manno-octulosonic acid kinase